MGEVDKKTAEWFYELAMDGLKANDLNTAINYLWNAGLKDPTEKKYILEFIDLAIKDEKLLRAKEGLDELPNRDFSFSDSELQELDKWRKTIIEKNDKVMRKYLEVIKKDDWDEFYAFYNQYHNTCFNYDKIRDQFGLSPYHYMVLFKTQNLLRCCGPEYDFYENDDVENNCFLFFDLDVPENDLLVDYFKKYDRDAGKLDDNYKKQKRNNNIKKGVNGVGKLFKAFGEVFLEDMERNLGTMSQRASNEDDKERYSDAKEQAKGYKESYQAMTSGDLLSTKSDDEMYDEYSDEYTELYVRKYNHFKSIQDDMKNSKSVIERTKYKIIKNPQVLEEILTGDYASYVLGTEKRKTYCLPEQLINE